MTRKDYILIADICVSTIQMGLTTGINDFINHVTAELLRTNSNFDAAKFKAYIKKRL